MSTLFVVLVRNANGQYVARGWFETEGEAMTYRFAEHADDDVKVFQVLVVAP